jgi:hypothetical protein
MYYLAVKLYEILRTVPGEIIISPGTPMDGSYLSTSVYHCHVGLTVGLYVQPLDSVSIRTVTAAATCINGIVFRII